MPKNGIIRAEDSKVAYMSFKHLNLDPEIEAYLEANKINTPTPIQNLAITKILTTKNNFFIGAQTGAGKTLCYLLPIFQLLKDEEKLAGEEKLTMKNRPRAIIIAPSKELISQIVHEAKKISHHSRLAVLRLNSDSSFRSEREGLEKGADIVVTTIQRLEAHIRKGNLYTS